MPLVAHHVDINLFDLLAIEPETMPEHAVLAAVSAVRVALVCSGGRAALTLPPEAEAPALAWSAGGGLVAVTDRSGTLTVWRVG